MIKSWEKLYNQTKPLLDKYYPGYESAKDYARKFLADNLTQGEVVLDLGCGHHSEDFVAVKNRIKLIGVDFDLSAAKENMVIDEFKQADLNKKLPFAEESFDLVYSRFVMEHVKEPQKTYQEVYRILKKDRYFIVLVPNLYNPVIFLSKIMPHGLIAWLKAKLTGTKEEEVYPTYYRTNTAAKITKQLSLAGFKNIQIVRKGGVFEYFMANKFLFRLAIIWEKITDHICRFKKLHLVVICQK